MTQSTTSPSKIDVQGLIERVEKATGPDRELECEVVSAVFGAREARVHGRSDLAMHRYTTSIDAALALTERLVPRLVIKFTRIGDGSGFLQVTEAWIADTGIEVVYDFDPLDPKPGAIAILLATLKALQAQGETE